MVHVLELEHDQERVTAVRGAADAALGHLHRLSRIDDDRRTEANRKAERESVKSLQLETIAEVWRSYYDFQTAVKKYQFAQALLAAAQESYNDNLDTYRQGLRHDH